MTRTIAASLGMFLLAQGCQAPLKRDFSPQRQEPASLGMLGLYSVGATPKGVVEGPVGTGEEAVRGAVQGGSIGLGSGAASGALTGALIGLGCGPGAIFCVPAAILTGSAIGAASGLVVGGTAVGVKRGTNAIPTEVAEKVTAALNERMKDRDLSADLRLRTLALEQGAGRPKDLGGEVSRPRFTSDYARFAESGVDTVLEITVVRVALVGAGGEDPDLALAIEARARLIRLPWGQALSEGQELVFTSAPAKATEWMADDSLRLESELDHGVETLAAQLAEVVA